MTMQTNLSGRLRNTSLPLANGLHPLFEAVVNSIHAIEEAGLSNNHGMITIKIFREHEGLLRLGDPKKRRGPDAQEDILGFKVIENGIGFTDANMKSFNTLDSEHKVKKGGRGIGRFLWLKAFKWVTVESILPMIIWENKRNVVLHSTQFRVWRMKKSKLSRIRPKTVR